jgi:hypothetical protein
LRNSGVHPAFANRNDFACAICSSCVGAFSMIAIAFGRKVASPRKVSTSVKSASSHGSCVGNRADKRAAVLVRNGSSGMPKRHNAR